MSVPYTYTVDMCYEDIDRWMVNYHEAHPEDDRADLDVFLDGAVYHAESPYWPPRDAEGRLTHEAEGSGERSEEAV